MFVLSWAIPPEVTSSVYQVRGTSCARRTAYVFTDYPLPLVILN
jgi:hypothetical protein